MSEPVLKKGKRKVLYKNRKGMSPKISLPGWWFGEDDDEVYVEIYPNYIIIYRLGFGQADKVLEKLRGGGKNGRGAPLQEG